MKKIYTTNLKTIALIISSLVLGGFSAFAQESQIELPDLTTEVTGAKEEIQPIPTPDFSKVVVTPTIDDEIVAQLPAENPDNIKAPSGNLFQSEEKKIFAEGQIGGGYPATFIGDFSVSRLYGTNPFKIDFKHASAAGFSGNSLSSEYTSSNTVITVDKKIAYKNTNWDLGALYEDSGNGLQSKVEAISANKQDFIGAYGKFDCALPKGFSLGFNLDTDFYFRYADVTNTTNDLLVIPDWIKNTTTYYLQPEFYAKWTGKGFETGFTADYSLEAGNGSVNRGEFDLDFAWKSSQNKVRFFTKIGAVVSDSMNSGVAMVPFNAGINLALPVSFSDRRFTTDLYGGLSSIQTKNADYEKLYKFTANSGLTSETTMWNVNFALSLPVQNSFSFQFNSNYMLTAFGNGMWQPVYLPEALESGLYTYAQNDFETLSTKLAFSYTNKNFALQTGWKAFWMDVPALENGQVIYADLSFRTFNGIFGADLNIEAPLDCEDKVPVVDLSLFIKMTPAVTLQLATQDFAKLVSGEERIYSGQYISKGGDVTLLVKFLF